MERGVTMHEISVRTHFSAAHRLTGYEGTCANLHGHNWEVEVAVRGEKLDETGMLVDFRKLKDAVRETTSELDHADLNSLAAFKSANPTSENIARHLFERLRAMLAGHGCKLDHVTVRETPNSSATYRA